MESIAMRDRKRTALGRQTELTRFFGINSLTNCCHLRWAYQLSENIPHISRYPYILDLSGVSRVPKCVHGVVTRNRRSRMASHAGRMDSRKSTALYALELRTFGMNLMVENSAQPPIAIQNVRAA
ncbi:hypothetical protein MPTK1_2g02070 [Marchantia polymorpha subsp. ruderalis]|uniref:Uncharacterized protein n=1 Tax=Marchantia polymorpha TaxID=3197 RepID=A0A2R6W8A3_MARPO|nr:hypothetical protein MARPO_0130s0015 [Marchantia polymorpha]BBN00782.1 hypothetical protein Mp_2g02070 [Marchantia polymorpha subsp. ruderalis]|eukprot:PTQ30059.1 hypothetical protein MARPO_0130s0015 [Marchantia polymorpha]